MTTEIEAKLREIETDRVSNERIKDWAEKHDLQGSMTDLRCIYEDAQTLGDTKPKLVQALRRALDCVSACASDHKCKAWGDIVRILSAPNDKEGE